MREYAYLCSKTKKNMEILRIPFKPITLEDEDISLEDSFRQYQEGMELLKYCHETIESVEQKVQAIAKDGSLEDFE